MKITKQLNLFKDNIIHLNNKKVDIHATLKFFKTPKVVHKIMIVENLKKGVYRFENVYPIFTDTFIDENTEIIE